MQTVGLASERTLSPVTHSRFERRTYNGCANCWFWQANVRVQLTQRRLERRTAAQIVVQTTGLASERMRRRALLSERCQYSIRVGDHMATRDTKLKTNYVTVS